VNYYRILSPSGPRWGLEDRGTLRLLSAAPYAGGAPTGEAVDLAAAPLLSPATPSKIVAIGLNYKDHARELGYALPEEPLLFFKPPSAVVGPGEPIVLPEGAGRVDYEAELGLVVGRKVKGLRSEEDAARAIFGCVCVNDVTAREIQKRDVQFDRSKGFDTFAPVGPAIAAGLDPRSLGIACRVGTAVVQRSRTDELIFSPAFLVAYVSRVMTLLPGDIISTGTPAGVGPLAPGDVVEVEVEGCGVLRNPRGRAVRRGGRRCPSMSTPAKTARPSSSATCAPLGRA
jgi:2-keto-4-pentenoate hydratase/2-oxohepta-3-ene-1,7-dioic acid hydratase in catechol pathway